MNEGGTNPKEADFLRPFSSRCSQFPSQQSPGQRTWCEGLGVQNPVFLEVRRSRLDGPGACVGLGEGVQSCCGGCKGVASLSEVSPWSLGSPWPTAAAVLCSGGRPQLRMKVHGDLSGTGP